MLCKLHSKTLLRKYIHWDTPLHDIVAMTYVEGFYDLKGFTPRAEVTWFYPLEQYPIMQRTRICDLSSDLY